MDSAPTLYKSSGAVAAVLQCAACVGCEGARHLGVCTP